MAMPPEPSDHSRPTPSSPSGAARLRRRRWPWLVAAIALLVVVLALVWDWNWFKAYAERRVEAATGRDFRIGGDLDVDLGFAPVISAGKVRLGNAEWSEDADMASAERLRFSVRLWPLLGGRYDLPFVHLERPRLLLERNADGEANWRFADDDEPSPPAPPLIRQLTVADGELRVRDPPHRTDVRLDVRSGEAGDEHARAPLIARGEGRYRGRPFELAGQVESPLELRSTGRPYRVDVRARAGATRTRARGELIAPLQFGDFDVRFELSGPDLGDLYPLLGIALPTTPPYTLDGRLSREGDTWRYRDFRGTVGDSDLGGDASIDLSGERPALVAELSSKRLDLDDLAGFLGAPPGTGENETASPEQIAEAQRLRARGRVLPDRPYALSKLRAMDADVKLRAAQVQAPPLPIDTLSGHLRLQNGVVRLDPLQAGVAGGEIVGWVTMDASREPIATSLKLQARRLELPRLFPNAQLVGNSSGRIAGQAELEGRGNSIAAMLGSAGGELGLAMGPGRISNLLIELAGLDIAEALAFLLTEDRVIPVRCAYADFGVDDGVATTRAFAFDTTDTVIFGEGSLDFGDESLDLRLRPQPKDRSILALRVPLRIGGTLADPSFRPEGGPLLLRGIAAAALYSAAPPAALLALIEFGPGEDARCGPERSREEEP